MNIVKSALGYYEPLGNPAEADVIIGHSFGTDKVNRVLAEYITTHADSRPIVADLTLVDAFPGRDDQVDHVVRGPVSNAVGQGVGTWGTLEEGKRFMDREGLQLALMVGHAHHIGRIAMQAEKQGIRSVIPSNLPRDFDPQSEQVWTRSLLLWVPREVLGSLYLRHQKKL